ncbi:MAG: hypothetical protein HXY43_11025 [Fischerella sp.]|jgi:hypothetical protein|uniref:NF038122 family metalloprotease n=1 Tax=Fischerella sp. TaxID=1191 RepID=UPI0017A17379|nr:NF038122 family metalloprotease [Fischerella sp.]NWF59798.1 hypothetical protein [Fischerella sp.]
MILKIQRFLSVAKLTMKKINHQKSPIYSRINKVKQATCRGKLFLLGLLVGAVIIGNFQLAQAQNTTYTTTDSKTTAKFQIYYGPETTLDQMIGTELAGKIWSQYLGDNVTIKLFASTTSGLPKNVLGSSTAEMLKNRHSYEELYKQLSVDKKSPNDFTADQNRLKFPYLSVMLNGKVIENVDKTNITRANAKALGFLSGTDSTDFDGHIVLSKDLTNISNVNTLSWSYNYSNNEIPLSSLDYLTTMVHEIGHILGFVSGIDNPHLEAALRDTEHPITDDVIDKIFTPLDLERFSDTSKNQVIKYDSGKYSWTGIPDLSIGGNPFLTFDKGNSTVEKTATGEETSLGGDGEQGSHWKKGTDGIMDPYLQTGKREVITHIDLTALDLMGWDVRSPAIDLEQLAQKLPTLYKEAKKTAEDKMANASTWFLLSPPELVNPVGGDANVTYTIGEGDSQSCSSNNGVTYCYNSSGSTSCSSNNGVTSCISETGEVKTISQSSLDPSLETYCQDSKNQSKPDCLLWRSSGFHKYWDAYFQKMIFLNQKWLPNATTTSDAKTVSEVFATLGLVGYK